MTDAEIIDALKKFYGCPPYDNFDNWCKGDGYFKVDLLQKTGANSLPELCKRVGFKR